MKNLIRKLITGTALIGALAGCSSNSVNYSEQSKTNPAEIYSSPTVRYDSGFEVVGRSGNVDETKPIFKKDSNLYVVGFGKPSHTEVGARISASMNALNNMNKLTGKNNLKKFYCPDWEIIKLKDKKIGQLYVVEALCKIPLENYQESETR